MAQLAAAPQQQLSLNLVYRTPARPTPLYRPGWLRSHLAAMAALALGTTSLALLVATYIGLLGLVLVIGAGCLIGACLAAAVVCRGRLGLPLRTSRARAWPGRRPRDGR